MGSWVVFKNDYQHNYTLLHDDPIVALRDTGEEDSIKKLKYKPRRFSTYQFDDRRGNTFSTHQSKSALDLKPSNLERNVTVDSGRNFYTVEEKVGGLDYRPPSLSDYNTLNQRRDQSILKDYWRNEGAGLGEENTTSAGKGITPRIPIGSQLFGRIFGGDYVEFKPTGFVNLDFAYRRQNVANPAVPAARQSNGVFDFDPHANVNLIGQVGEKLRITTSFDTKASFDFENNFRVEYTGYPEEIIQKIEFGNINFPLPTSLITGSQNLFGVKSELKFGKLRVNSVFANQRASQDQIVIQGGGAQLRNFEIRASDYEENKHFFLSQFFRDNFENALATMPVINSGVLITRVEVYVTNRTNNTENLRNTAAFLDLGEADPFSDNTFITPGSMSDTITRNEANRLYNSLLNNASFRGSETISNAARSQNLQQGEDFEILRGARQLQPSEFTFHQQLGYVSLNTPLRNDEILAVAYEYTFNGRVLKVGELSDDYLNRPQEDVIFLKMLRPSTIRTDLPTWDLMMKNIYSLNANQINQSNFLLRIIYRDDITGVDNPALQEGQRTRNVNLLRVFGLDQLNPRGDRQLDGQGQPIGDGNFDYVEGITIDAAAGRIIFPRLEPFGSDLEEQFTDTEQALKNRYVFQELYDGTRNDAQNNFANKNKFFIKGQYEGTTGNTQYLPGINIAENSVVVRAGNTLLTEGVDYTVNYSTGQVTIVNEAILNSGNEITIDYEKSDFFNVQPRTFIGTRFDYSLGEDVNLGATYTALRERPVLTRVAAGTEALNNTMLGADINLKKESRFLTRLTDALPLVQTKEESSIAFSAEVAQLRPSAARLSGAVSYLDDFEGAETPFDLTRTANLRWKLGATPAFIAEEDPSDPLAISYRRAQMAWYNIDNTFYRGDGVQGRPDNISDEDMENHYVRAIPPQEIFRNRQNVNIATNETTFDVAFFPSERGPFNYNPNLTPEGLLPNPEQSFGAITRAITTEVDFDNANVEYIEFWLLDPFIEGERGRVITDQNNGVNNTTGGQLVFHLGSISEDVMRDSRHFFENGLPITEGGEVDQTAWGNVPAQQYINDAFDNTAGARGNQDVGLDGVRTEEEATIFDDYLNSLPAGARAAVAEDPSADNFRFYLGGELDAQDAQIIERYKYYNNTEGNSPENSGGQFTASSTNLPDNEDLNTDNTLSELEEYYEYRIQLNPDQLTVGSPYIVDQVTVQDQNVTQGDEVTWYQFRIPIREFDGRVGNIDGFKSIRYMRMVLNGFQQPVVLRMAQFQLVANQWRRFLGNLNDKNLQLPSEPYDPSFVASTVNIEENSVITSDGAIPYDLPPGSQRDIDITSINNRELNEQAVQICVEGLEDRDARAIYKNVNFDFRFYKRLKMFIHASSEDAQDGEVAAFIRIGTDFTENYYEVEIPLQITTLDQVNAAPGREARQRTIWPLENELDIAIEDIIDTKVERNRSFNNQNLFVPFSRQVGQYRVTVVGNPDLSTALVMMLGVRNPSIENDDLQPKSACIWFNELRTEEFDQTNGWAGVATLNMQLADFANITASGGIKTFGFGTLNQRIAERETKTTREYEVQGTFALDKFLPQELGLRIPMFVSYQRRNASPEFDPLDPDVRLDRSVEKFGSNEEQRDYRQLVEENETRRSINFTNVRKVKTNPEAKSRLWDISNFSATWSYSDLERSDVNTAQYLEQNWRTGLAYNYTNQPKSWEPFKKSKLFKSPWLRLIRDFNIAFGPTSITVRGDLDRTFKRTELRSGTLASETFEPFFEKYFLFNRFYDVQWSVTKSLAIGYTATAQAVIDEPAGEIDTQANRDSVRQNLLNLGRMQNFRQDINATYKVPLDKFPLTDWVSADLGYRAGYEWTAASVGLQDILGNTIRNNRERNLRGRIDMIKLYNKVKILKEVNNSKPKPKKPPVKPTNPQDTTQKKKPSISENAIVKGVLRALMSLRTVTVTYGIQETTTLPGFGPTPRYLGLSDGFEAPGWNFVLGDQDPDIRFQAADNEWLISADTNIVQNVPFSQSLTENLNIQASVIPFRDFKIQLDARRTRTVGFQELFRDFRDTLGNGGFQSRTPVRTGTYGISILSIQTMFRRSDETINSETFEQFVANRDIVRERLTQVNDRSSPTRRYTNKSQDVLISSFIAAYTGQDASSANLSPFPRIPIPNWRIDYAGLSKVGFLKEYFNTININHSYTSEYRVANYTSSLEYQSPEQTSIDVEETNYQIPTEVNEVDSTFIPVYVIGQVIISERMAPVIGVNLRTKSNLNIKLDYNRSRDLSLNLSNAQVTEVRSNDIVIGLGFTKKNLRLPFKDSDRKNVVLKNNVDFRVDFSIRDTKTFQRSAEQEDVVTGGNRNFQLKPNVSYNVDQRLTMQAYVERSINTPAISNSFPRRNTTVGVQIRYNLTE